MATAYSSLLGLALPVQGELTGQWGDTVNDYITKYLDASVAGGLSITADVTLTKTTGSALGATSSQYAILTCSPASVNIVVTAPAAYKIYVVNNTSASYTVTIRGAGPTTGVVLAALEKAVVAWNGTDFFKVATSATDGVSTFSAGSTGLTPSSATSGAVTLAGTLAVANGGTGVTTSTGTTNVVLSNSPTLVTPVLGVATATSLQGIIGNVTPAAGTFTTLTTSSTVTVNGGTANGVAYLDGSKVLTTGSALTWDGSLLSTTVADNTVGVKFKATTSNIRFLPQDGGAAKIAALNAAESAFYPLITQGSSLQYVIDTTEIGRFSSTGLAVTGTLSATGTLSGGTSGTAYSFSGSAPATSLTLTSGGDLGIGTSSPVGRLEAVGGTGAGFSGWFRTGDATAANNAGGGFYNTSSATAASRQAVMVLDADGANLGGGDYFVIQKNGNSGTADILQYSNASMRFGTNYTARAAYDMTLDSAGNLGLGVTPSAWGAGTSVIDLNTAGGAGALASSGTLSLANNGFFNGTNWIYKISSTALLYQLISNEHRWSNAASGTAGNAISFTQAMTLDASGRLSLGTTTASTGFSAISLVGGPVGVNTGIQLTYNSSTYGGGAITTVNAAGGGLSFFTFTGNVGSESYTERARIDSSGNLLVGKTSSGTVNIGVESRADGTFISTKSGTTSATETMIVYSTGASALRFYVSMDGTVNATSATISAISDIRFKENVRDLDVGLDKIMALKPRLYDWKEGKGANIKNARGFIAQEFETVFPDLIDKWKDPAPEGEDPYKSVRQDLMPVLVKAIQEQQALIIQLTARITALETA